MNTTPVFTIYNTYPKPISIISAVRQFSALSPVERSGTLYPVMPIITIRGNRR